MGRGMRQVGFVQIGQAETTFSAVVISQKAIHPGVRGFGSKDQIRPLDGLILVAVLHQPARGLAAESRVGRVAEQISANLRESRLVILELVHDLLLGVGLGLFP